MEMREAIRHVIPIIKDFSMDAMDVVRESLAAQLDKIVLYFFNVRGHIAVECLCSRHSFLGFRGKVLNACHYLFFIEYHNRPRPFNRIR